MSATPEKYYERQQKLEALHDSLCLTLNTLGALLLDRATEVYLEMLHTPRWRLLRRFGLGIEFKLISDIGQALYEKEVEQQRVWKEMR